MWMSALFPLGLMIYWFYMFVKQEFYGNFASFLIWAAATFATSGVLVRWFEAYLISSALSRFDNKIGSNFFYVHSAIEKNIGKIISLVKLEGITKGKNEEIGNKIAMHIAALNPLAIDKDGIDKKLVDKELEIIKAEITNSGKPADMAEKISKGKISKFLNDNSLLNQIWIMDPKKKVSDVLKEKSPEQPLKVLNFVRYKVGEGV